MLFHNSSTLDVTVLVHSYVQLDRPACKPQPWLQIHPSQQASVHLNILFETAVISPSDSKEQEGTQAAPTLSHRLCRQSTLKQMNQISSMQSLHHIRSNDSITHHPQACPPAPDLLATLECIPGSEHTARSAAEAFPVQHPTAWMCLLQMPT